MLGGNGTRREEKWAPGQRAEQQMAHMDQRGLGRGGKNEAEGQVYPKPWPSPGSQVQTV